MSDVGLPTAHSAGVREDLQAGSSRQQQGVRAERGRKCTGGTGGRAGLDWGPKPTTTNTGSTHRTPTTYGMIYLAYRVTGALCLAAQTFGSGKTFLTVDTRYVGSISTNRKILSYLQLSSLDSRDLYTLKVDYSWQPSSALRTQKRLTPNGEKTD